MTTPCKHFPSTFGGHKTRVAQTFPITLRHTPFSKCKTSLHHLFLNPTQSKEGLRSSWFLFFPGGCDFRQRQGGRSTCCQPPHTTRRAARRPQAAAEREGERAGSPCKVCPVLSNNTRCHCIPKSVPGALFITTETQNPAGQKRRRERERPGRAGKQPGEISRFSRICLEIFKLD